jgi:hypothetical protein
VLIVAARPCRQWLHFFCRPWSLPTYLQTDQEIPEEKWSGQIFHYIPLLKEFNGDLVGVRVPTAEEDGDDKDRPALKGKLQS